MKMGMVMKEAWGTWLSCEWDWEWFVTLTFKNASMGRAAANTIWRTWVSEMEKSSGTAPGFVRVTERTPYRYAPHYHALMLNVDGLRRTKWHDRWVTLAGWAKVLPYYPTNGASYYVSKYIAKDISDMVFSDNIGDLRRSADGPAQMDLDLTY